MTERVGCKALDSSGQIFTPPYSGLYTPDLKRYTILPEFLIRVLDRLYLRVERYVQFHKPFKWLCWHYFLLCVKSSEEETDML